MKKWCIYKTNKYRKNIMKSRFDILESSKKFREKDRDDVTSAYKLLSVTLL